MTTSPTEPNAWVLPTAQGWVCRLGLRWEVWVWFCFVFYNNANFIELVSSLLNCHKLNTLV